MVIIVSILCDTHRQAKEMYLYGGSTSGVGQFGSGPIVLVIQQPFYNIHYVQRLSLISSWRR